MESPTQDGVFLHTLPTPLTFRSVTSMRLSTGGSLEPEQKDSEKETTESRGGPLTLTRIEFRIQQLNNRCLLLQEIQRCTKKEERNNKGGLQRVEESDEMNELKSIQKELKELQVKKLELENKGAGVKKCINEGDEEQQQSYKQTPRGGIYMLPPPMPNQEVPAAEQTDSSRIIPVETLGRTAEVTKCPSCEEVIVTETYSTRGGAMWILCFMCTFMGCVAGCCLIPFCMKRLRNTNHRCPRCQASIHTHHPL